jgi:hypothetical protein
VMYVNGVDVDDDGVDGGGVVNGDDVEPGIAEECGDVFVVGYGD